MTREVCGLPLAEWRSMPWWPNGIRRRIDPGPPGHEREIVINLGDSRYTWDDPIPQIVVDVLTGLLPEGWTVDNRGTRIEVHPTGRRYQGFDATTDVPEIARALREAFGEERPS